MTAVTSNEVVIAAPLAAVWDITNNVAGWPDLFSEYAEANVIRRHGDTVVFELAMHPDENGVVWKWVSQRTSYEAERRVYAHRVETGPFEFMQIFWQYDDLGSAGTRMRWEQRFRMRPGAPVDDAQMTNRINANTVVQMARIKAKIEASHGLAEVSR